VSNREHTIDAKVRADTTDFHRGMSAVDKDLDKAGQGFSKYGSEAVKAGDQFKGFVQANRSHMEMIGKGALTMGAAAVAGLGLAAKAAMDWESAWAGVTKTVDGTPAQMDELEKSLRGLAKTLPATHEEIAGVAEAAGQLGVARENVVGFTKTMVDLGETTNLTADEAATSIAQISNVMGTMDREGAVGVERFSSTLVALGNAGASTEAEILEMAKRIAGAGKLVGASESDVLALSNAMASLGIEAQLGGGVMSRVMQRMYEDVKGGGEGLDNLAKVAGVSAKDFATAFETDPVRAVDMMVKGFGRIKDEGGNVISTMGDLGIKGTEETGVILRLAGAGDILTDSLKLGDSAWESNSALAEEAAKRYETTESKVKVAWNNIKDAAIEAGAVLLPMIAGIAEGAASVAQAFGNLPEPVKGALTVLGGVGGVALLGAGAFLTLTPKVLDAMEAFNKLAPAGGKARDALSAVGKAAVPAAALVTFTLIVARLAEADYMSKIDTGMGRISLALAEIATSGPGAKTALDEVFKNRDGGQLISTVTDLESAIKRTFNRDGGQQFNDWGEAVINGMTGVRGSSQILNESFERLDRGLSDLVSSGNADDAAKAFERIKQAAEEQDVSIEELATKFPQYADALKAAEAASKTAAAETDNVKVAVEGFGSAAATAAAQSEEIEKALEDIGLAADGSVTDLAKFTDALLAAGLLQLSARDAARGFEAAIDALDESLKVNGRTLDTTTDKGRANEAALDAIAGAGYRSAEAMAKNGASQEALQGNLQATHDRLKDAARQFTDTDEEAEALTRDIMKIPPGVDIKTWMGDEAKRMAEGTKIAVEAIPPRKDVVINIREETHRIAYEQRVISSGGNEPEGGGLYGSDRGKAIGGPVTGSGPKGVDAEWYKLAPGEHIWTDREVDAAGGHGAVAAMRRQVLGGGLQYATPAQARVPSSATSGAPFSLDGYRLELNADATMGTFRRIAGSAASSAVSGANDDIYRGRSRWV
jgi:TP901 family phage tail tape measure protein